MVITPQVLWKDFDRKLLPLNETVISSRKEKEFCEQNFYFNGEPSAPGCTRVFARLVTPVSDNLSFLSNAGGLAVSGNKKAILLLSDAETELSAVNVTPFTARGYTTLVMDYAGDYNNHDRFTIYPSSLRFANYLGPESLVQSASLPTKTCWYIWAVSTLRAVALLEKLGYDKIVLFGAGIGSVQVWKAAYFEGAVTAAITLFNAPLLSVSEPSDNSFLTYKASLDTYSYAPLIKTPLLEIVTSNDRTGSLDRMNDIFVAITRDDCRFCIEPRANRSLSPEQYANILNWLAFYLDGVGVVPPRPKLTASSSDRCLYYEISLNTSEVKPQSVRLFVAQNAKACAYRNWRICKAERVGESEWLVKVDVYAPKEPLFAFVSVSYENGFTFNSDVLMRVPAMLGVAATEFIKKRLIYDSDMGEDDWLGMSKNMERKPLSLSDGPFGIRGIALSGGSLSTFKLGDVVFSGTQDNVLQLILFSSILQEITFSVTVACKDFLRQYSCVREVSPNDDWSKLTLSSTDFKSPEGVLDGWENVVYFEITAEHLILVNSLLWV